MSSKRKYELASGENHSFSRMDRFGKTDLDSIRPVCKRAEIIRDGRKFPTFQKPSTVGVFSVDANRKCRFDASMLKYLYWNNSSNNSKQNVQFDLNEGLQDCIRKDELMNEKLDQIFCWLKAEGDNIEECQKSDFVCFRGLLTTIMSTPYEQQEGWIICAQRLNNTIFMCAFDTERRKAEKRNTSDKLKRFQSWGYKFEQFMLAEEPGQEPDTSRPVVESEELACVFRTKLNVHSIIYAAEMDGVRSDEPCDVETLRAGTVPFVELKTSRHVETQRQDNSFKRYKLLKWWCQSFLVGIQSIYCGFRDDDGIVSVVKEYEVRELPKMAKGLWDPCVCMNFCSQFLDFVKSCVNEGSHPNALWKFEWMPGRSITGQELDANNSEFAFVPDWYTSVHRH